MSEPIEPTEHEPTSDLLERWRAGDVAARDELAAHLQPWLHREMSKLLAERRRGISDSIDLAQSAVLEFLTWGPKFVPRTPAQFKALLKRIATNELLDQRRREELRAKGGHVESFQADASGSFSFAPAERSSLAPSRAAESNENVAWVRLALQFLSVDERQLLRASHVDEKSWAEVAAALGHESPDAARVRCDRLKSRVGLLLIQLRGGRMPSAV